MGDEANDTGYLILRNVRIPREFMLMNYSYVTPEGKYVRKKVDPKVHYATMVYTRCQIICMASHALAKRATIAVRYNAIRKQEFVDSKSLSYKSVERPLLDYKAQQYRLFKQLALCYAFKSTSSWMLNQVRKIEGDEMNDTIKNSEGL